MTLMRALLLGLGLSALAALPAAAQALEAPEGMARAEILPGWRTAEGTHVAALRIVLAPGWKTYWRAPGEAGIPPRFGWAGSRNLAALRMHWPRPEVYDVNGLRAIGYHGELVLPIEFTPERADRPVRLKMALEFGVCRDICVPVAVRLTAELPAGGGPDARIEAALAARPRTAGEAGVGTVRCTVEPISDGLRLTARIDMPSLGPGEVAVFELPDQSIWVSEAEGRREGGLLVAASDLVPPSAAPFALDRSQILITVLGPDRAVEIAGCSGG